MEIIYFETIGIEFWFVVLDKLILSLFFYITMILRLGNFCIFLFCLYILLLFYYVIIKFINEDIWINWNGIN